MAHRRWSTWQRSVEEEGACFNYQPFHVERFVSWLSHLIRHVLGDHALLLLDPPEVVGVLPTELGRQRHDDGKKPHEEYHGEHPSTGPGVDVIHVRYDPVPGSGEIKRKGGVVGLAQGGGIIYEEMNC